MATRCALDEGIVIGGGAALLYASLALKDIKMENFDQQHGIDIIRKALQYPCKKIAQNAGVEGAVIVQQLLNLNDFNKGYDAYNDRVVDMFEAGIIDPSSIASLMITTEAAIVEAPKEKGSMPDMSGMGGMGGMGGMM